MPTKLPGLDSLSEPLKKELLRHEERMTTAVKAWRETDNQAAWDEAHCGAMCLWSVANTHHQLNETIASKRARSEIARLADRWAVELVHELRAKRRA